MIGVVKCILLVTLAVAASGQNVNTNDVIFHLFTRDNPTQSQALIAEEGSILVSRFSDARPTVFVIHSNEDHLNFFSHTTSAHLTAQDVNVLGVDWTRGAGMYSQGLASAPNCGRIVAQFINILINSFQYSASRITIVGVGLGAHVAGIAARRSEGTIPLVVGLDPSLHGWTHHPDRLGRDAATVVEVIHTTAGHMGYDDPLGHIDFYPNGGSHQPGCAFDPRCSHSRSYLFYSESVLAHDGRRSQFVGTRCDSLQQATTMQCTGPRGVIFGGLHEKSGVTGIFTFVTNIGSPFARS